VKLSYGQWLQASKKQPDLLWVRSALLRWWRGLKANPPSEQWAVLSQVRSLGHLCPKSKARRLHYLLLLNLPKQEYFTRTRICFRLLEWMHIKNQPVLASPQLWCRKLLEQYSPVDNNRQVLLSLAKIRQSGNRSPLTGFNKGRNYFFLPARQLLIHKCV
jgi:hypothetical protein